MTKEKERDQLLVEAFFTALAKFCGSELTGKWQKNLENKIKKKEDPVLISIVKAKNITSWIHRGWIPEKPLRQLYGSPMLPTNLKKLCEKCKKKGHEAYGESSDGTMRPGLIRKHREKYKRTSEYKFRDPETGLEACQALSEIEILDREIFIDVVADIKKQLWKLKQLKKNGEST